MEIHVASGKVAVPDLSLMDKAAAAAALTRLNLTMQVAEYVVDDTVAPDSVLSQDPAKGQLVEVGSVVKVKVAKASPVTTTITLAAIVDDDHVLVHNDHSDPLTYPHPTPSKTHL